MVDTCRETNEYEVLPDDSYQKLEHASEEDITFEIFGYKHSKCHSFIFHTIAILLLGVPYLIVTWYKQLEIFKYKKISLKDANTVYVKDSFGQASILPVENDYIIIEENQCVKYFTYHYSKYIWQNDSLQFIALKVPNEKLELNSLIDDSHGLTAQEHRTALKIHGQNKITIDVKSYCQLFIEEVFNPFYLFQIFSIVLWSCDEYYIYAGCIFFLSVVSISTSLYETKKQSRALHNLVESSNCQSIQVCRPLPNTNNEMQDDEQSVLTVDAADLVPDDLIIVPSNGCIMPCDAVLLSGICIVNESMLTGESVPVTKTPPHHSPEAYSVDLHKRHTLFAGTHVIQTRFYGGSKVIARVIRTGFYTSKGELIKSIMFPKPTGFKFYKDSLMFILCLAVIATTGMAYCIYLYSKRHASLETILIRALDIITIVVPPALPAAMTVGTIYSQNRLRARNIFCISPPRINVCGKVKLVCFDKTGTLTQDGLEFYGVLPCCDNKFTYLIHEPKSMDQKSALLQAMATCHSLTRIDGEITGDPLDISMFESTNWVLEEPGTEETRFDLLAPSVVKPETIKQASLSELDLEIPYEIGIIRQFQFSSTQQCMSVICRILGATSMTVFTKGAPEKVQMICRKDSIPEDYSTTLANYTTSGYRVIAIAYKHLSRKIKWKDALKVKRETIETDLEFLGLIVMQNTLKPETTPIIKELHLAKVRTVMVTGDNVMTAISVSRDCGMVQSNENIGLLEVNEDYADTYDMQQVPKTSIEILGSPVQNNDHCLINLNPSNFHHIALDGKTWSVLRTHYPHLIPGILLRGTIFARFRPEQKTQLVTSLQQLDYVVAMCGDGANDCGALKAANIGVSLSQAEASVAAPFTSARQDISCVKHLMLEGRCALVTSFSMFKYMAMYSLIQFFTVLILYKKFSILGNIQFLYIDLVITTSLAITMGHQGPAHILTPKRPMGSLVCLVNLIPLTLQVVLCGVIQYAALLYLTTQPWFSPLLKTSEDHEDGEVICWENTVVFSVSCFQYMILACVYSKGLPHRQSILTNGLLLFTVVSLTIFTVVLLVYPVGPLAEFFEMMPLSKNHHKFYFRCKVLLFPLAHFILAVLIETCMAERRWLKSLVHFITRKKKPKNKYKSIEHTEDYDNICSNSQCDIHC